VLQLADQRRLGGEEALRVAGVGGVVRHRRADPLDRDVAALEVVEGEKDLARGAVAETAEDAVLADHRRHRRQLRLGDGGNRSGERGGHQWRTLPRHSCIGVGYKV
jgi:hypothetical protein